MFRKFVQFIFKLLGWLFRSKIELNTRPSSKQPEQKIAIVIFKGDVNIINNNSNNQNF